MFSTISELAVFLSTLLPQQSGGFVDLDKIHLNGNTTPATPEMFKIVRQQDSWEETTLFITGFDDTPVVQFILVDDFRFTNLKHLPRTIKWELGVHTTVVVVLSRKTDKWFWVPVGNNSALTKSVRSFEDFAESFFTPERLADLFNKHYVAADGDVFVFFENNFMVASGSEFRENLVNTCHGYQGVYLASQNQHLTSENLKTLTERLLQVGKSDQVAIYFSHQNMKPEIIDLALAEQFGEAYWYLAEAVLRSEVATIAQRTRLLKDIKSDFPLPEAKFKNLFSQEIPVKSVEAALISGVVPANTLNKTPYKTYLHTLMIVFLQGTTNKWELVEKYTDDEDVVIADYVEAYEIILEDAGVLPAGGEGMLPPEYLFQYLKKLAGTFVLSSEAVNKILALHNQGRIL